MITGMCSVVDGKSYFYTMKSSEYMTTMIDELRPLFLRRRNATIVHRRVSVFFRVHLS